MQAQVTTEGGKRLSLGGFMAINRDRLKALPGDTLAELIKTDELELIYLHLQSMRNFERLRERLYPAKIEVAQPDEPPQPLVDEGAAGNGPARVH